MERPIGVFDSGVGGLTVLRSLMQHFPCEDFVYLGDTARLPYGTKGAATVVRCAEESAGFLMSERVKLIVVACNTASSVAIDVLENSLPVPVVGVVTPAVKDATGRSRTGVVGIVGTERTIRSEAYTRALKAIPSVIRVVGIACPLFVPLVEAGWVENTVARETARIYLRPFNNSDVDVLILGCTHYPLLRKVIQEEMGADVVLVESGEAIAREVRNIMDSLNITRRTGAGSRKTRYFVTDDPESFDTIAGRFMEGVSVKSDFIEIPPGNSAGKSSV